MSLLGPNFPEDYLNEAAALLCFGEQAPFKSREEVLGLTIKELNWWINKVTEIYNKQKEEMEKARRRR